jgi:hypothetical protein
MTWKIIIGLIVALMVLRLYRFSKYMKKYLVPYEIRIISSEKETESFRINFMAVFGKGYFKREYFTVIGNFESKREFSLQMLKEMLTMTEIAPFYQGAQLKTDEIKHYYRYLRSIQEASTTTIPSDYIVSFVIIDQAALNFAKDHL